MIDVYCLHLKIEGESAQNFLKMFPIKSGCREKFPEIRKIEVKFSNTLHDDFPTVIFNDESDEVIAHETFVDFDRFIACLNEEILDNEDGLNYMPEVLENQDLDCEEEIGETIDLDEHVISVSFGHVTCNGEHWVEAT